MKKSTSNKKLNLNRQTIQKLDSSKLNAVNAGNAGTTTVLVSSALATATSAPTIICGITILL